MTVVDAPPEVKEFLPEETPPIRPLTAITPQPRRISQRHDDGKNSENLPIERVHTAIRPVLFVAQCVTLLPLHGVLGSDYKQLRFSKCSVKTLLSLVSIIASSCLGILTVLLIFFEGVNYRVAGDVMYYMSNVLSMIAFYKLAQRWKPLMEKWAALEDSMAALPPIQISFIIVIITIYVVIVSLCEHTMAVLYNRSPGSIGWERYYQESFRQLFRMTSYSLWKGIVASILNFIIASTWNFTDLFLAALSISLSARYRQFNLELESVIHKEMNLDYWTNIREMYNELALLTKLVDDNVSFLILLSFTNNLYFICLQLLHTIEPVETIPKKIYLLISFCHLLIRACSVCLTAADVYDKSKAPISTLFSVPSSSYNREVQRMTLQVAFENLALTGCKFFSVTRTLMLTVAGTIATYEIVLLQFRNLSIGNCTTKYPNETQP